MTPFYFGPPERRMLGILAEATAAPRRAGVLLCNPYGQEAIRLHRTYRVLAQQLSRAGFDVLRFDYYATGDSEGADEEGDFDGWTRDLLAANEELVRRASPDRLVWAGVRLGASLAAEATRQLRGGIDRLVLCEAVSNGGAYLEELAAATRERLADIYDLPGYDAVRAAALRRVDKEALGFAMSPLLRSGIAALDADRVPPPQARACVLIDRTPSTWQQILARWHEAGVETRMLPLETAVDWLGGDVAAPPGLLLALKRAVEA